MEETSGLPHGFHVLAKPTGAVCNLDCRYCFFLSKEELYPGSTFRMRDEVLDAYIRQMFESHQAREVGIAWQGGEPCPRNRFIRTPGGDPGLNYLCGGYKLFFRHVAGPMTVMANLLRQGRPAAEVMGPSR